MKLMIKILSLGLTLCIASTCMVSTASAADTGAELIYDLELSDGSITNAVTGEADGFQLAQSSAGSVGTSEFISAYGAVPYIAMENSTSKLSFESTDEALVGGSYTLEAWLKFKKPGGVSPASYGRPFMNILGDTTDLMRNDNPNVMVGLASSTTAKNSSGDSTAMITWGGISGKSFRYQFAYLPTTYNHDNWYKFTLVREVSTEGTASSVTKRLYINGSSSLVGRNGSYAAQTYTTTDAPYSESKVSFNIGSYELAFDEFDIAEVKLYKGVRTDAEILADYKSEALGYTELKLVENVPVESSISIPAEGVEALSKPGATLVNLADSREIAAECRVDETGIITVSPGRYLEHEASYVLSFEDSSIDSFLVKTVPYELTVDSVSTDGGKVDVDLTVGGEAVKDLEVIVIARDSEGKILGIKSGSISDLSGSGSAPQIDMTAFADNTYSYKILVWELLTGYTRSVTAPVEVN